MAHSLFIGQTESGKTTLAKKLCQQYREAGVKTIVIDAAHNNWPCDYFARDMNDFIRVASGSRGCALFIDEAGEAVSWLHSEAVFIATKYRHLGHFAHFIAQRPTMIAPNVRGNCTRMFLFAVSREDAFDLAREWTHDEIREAHKLQQGEFLAVSRFGKPEKMRLF